MDKENNFSILDFGNSKLRFSVFSFDLKNLFSETISTKTELGNSILFDDIKKLIKKAEKKISTHINDIILLSDTPKSFVINLSLNKNFDIKSNTKNAYKILLLELKHLINHNYVNCEILHIIINKCIIDDEVFDELPKEKKIYNNIKIDFKVLCYPKEIINNFRLNLKNNNINILNIFSTSYIKSLNFVKKLNLKKTSFLDIGLKRSTFILYEDYKAKFIQSIPIGGYHITNDISKIFKISLDEAENIKKLFNKSETEFSYNKNSNLNKLNIEKFLNKKISIELLKKVILYRVQEIVDLPIDKFSEEYCSSNLHDTNLFLIGGGSLLLNNNSFYLRDKYKFKSINFYEEGDVEICKSALIYHLNHVEVPKINTKKQGLFEKFFNIFSK